MRSGEVIITQPSIDSAIDRFVDRFEETNYSNQETNQCDSEVDLADLRFRVQGEQNLGFVQAPALLQKTVVSKDPEWLPAPLTYPEAHGFLVGVREYRIQSL